MPTSRFSTMSIRPTPCTPAIVATLWISSVSGIVTPFTPVGTPDWNAISM